MAESTRIGGYLQALVFRPGLSVRRKSDWGAKPTPVKQDGANQDRRPNTRFRLRGAFGALFPLVMVCLLSGPVFAGVTASISGTVKDDSGAIIAGAAVSARNIETGVVQTQHTNAQGFYSFQSLPSGRYDIQVQESRFKLFREAGLVLDVNAALVVDAVLHIGQVNEVVEVSGEAQHVDTSSTQLGEVIGSQEMTSVPLVSRSYTDLLALQPGVVSNSSGMSGALAGPFNSTGVVVPLVSGDLNAGGLSVNGMREANNGFLLNGATVQEPGFGGTAVIPNLDSIAEFRILTNNFDAEYGNYSGGQINVITKSGTNGLHGDVFEFLRNTDFDAANYFDPGSVRGTYHQNQYGGTLGGPIKRDKIFFFADYQGNRVVQGVSEGQVTVPSAAEHAGDFSDRASQLTGTVVGTAWAQTLQQELGYPVSAGENYYTAGCASSAQCVFPNAQIPQSAFSAPAKNILPFIPVPNDGSFFETSSQALRLNDYKTSGRVDGNTQFGMLSAYYFLDNYDLTNPYPTASVPGFAAAGRGRTQDINLGDTKTLGNTSVNEVRFEYVRNNILVNQPSNGGAVSMSSLGFTTGANTLGIDVLNPAIQGVPELDFQTFTVGVPSRPNSYIENTFQWLDNFSKVVGTHTLRFGGAYHYNQMDQTLSNVVNGNFVFNTATETGIDFADFLIGAPAQYVQGVALPGNGRSHYIGAYGQDSWRVRSNLTLNYGLRWDVSTPWSEQHNQIETLVPGKQSATFPGSPTGWVFAGDPGIPSTLAPTRYDNFAPRIGLAYSPSASDGWLAKLTGGPGKTSIRAGYGMFYNSFEGATSFNQIGAAPFGFFYVGNNPSFTTPFINRQNGLSQLQRFPVAFPPLNASPSNSDNSVNWSVLLPIVSSPGIDINNRLPYAEDYEFSIQREFFKETLLTVSYVGTQAHRLLSTLESNPGSQSLCLFLLNPSLLPGGVNPNLAPNSPSCGPGGEDPGVGSPITLANGVTAPGYSGVTSFATTRLLAGFNSPSSDSFQSNGYFTTIGNSDYNSLQINLRHTSKRLQTLVGYTYSKALDDASGYGEQINPLNHAASRALSAFDETNNFVASYNYSVPVDRLGGPKRLTNGWQVSGITRFSTGLPVVIYESDDRSLLGTAFTGPIILDVDTPNYTPGSLDFKNPRSGQAFFNTTLFSEETLGQLGNSRRRFFHGPGVNNFDMALVKNTPLTERSNLEFRAEFFNIFNHAQFQNVQGNVNASNFGFAQSAGAPRIGQLALKLVF
jgi:Carboxypeptidase regulatory-like domain/TonB dependent receptor